jgi:hypothetical protein
VRAVRTCCAGAGRPNRCAFCPPLSQALGRLEVTGYLVNHQKKNKTFTRRERELMHAIRNDLGDEKIRKAAERLREAKFAVFKAKFSERSVLPAQYFSLDDVAKRDKTVARWLSMPLDDLIEQYRHKAT